jgi:hypothetical protein
MDYSFEAKETLYRTQVWGAVESFCSVPVKLRRIAILDTAQGLEVRHLLARGYSPQNILVINYSAAQLAAMTLSLRREGIEGVRTKAGDFCEVLMNEKTRVHVIGFDTTSNAASDDFERIAGPVLVHQPECLIEVMLGGREDWRWFELFRAQTDILGACNSRDSLNQTQSASHHARIDMSLLRATHIDGDCIAHARKVKWASYSSASGQQMVWSVAKLRSHETDRKWARCQTDTVMAKAIDKVMLAYADRELCYLDLGLRAPRLITNGSSYAALPAEERAAWRALIKETFRPKEASVGAA